MAYNKVSRLSTICFIALLLLLSSFALSTYATRPAPVLSDNVPAKAQLGEEEVDTVEESCGGVNEDECLMRRTLAAHIDYIYTQKHNP